MEKKRAVTVEDDGLPVLDVGRWARDKYRLVELYDKLFSTGMKNKWPTRVYIDLYAGPGFARVKATGRIELGSPLLALGVPDPFDKYIFCESDPLHVQALRQRVKQLFPNADARFICGDCNERINDICNLIPRALKGHGVLSFCFVDPFDISIKFSTVRHLSAYRMDFLFLLALHMDANRNPAHYTNPTNPKIDDFLGSPAWRKRWRGSGLGKKFPHFLAEEFSRQMEGLSYLPMPFNKMKPVRSADRNLPLYHLALFSKHKRAYEFWDQVLKYSTDQMPLRFDS